jgi:hypothetical protein
MEWNLTPRSFATAATEFRGNNALSVEDDREPVALRSE